MSKIDQFNKALATVFRIEETKGEYIMSLIEEGINPYTSIDFLQLLHNIAIVEKLSAELNISLSRDFIDTAFWAKSQKK